jgi:glycosyltransferase involved in cell wall biosynthesis
MAEKEGFKGQLTVTGLLDRSNLKKEMDLADVFINMSRQEALGVACLEAMASGIPVVASNAGGLKEVLDFGTAGFMIQNESVEDLVSTLEEINANPGLLQTKIANGLLQVEKFSVDRLRENIIRLFS